MATLLEKALEKVVVLPQADQDAIASQILASLADEEAWRTRFAEKRDVIRRLAREALEEDARGETLPLDDLLGCTPGLRVSSGVCSLLCPPAFNWMPGVPVVSFRAIRRTPVCNSRSWKARTTFIRFASVLNTALWLS
jgi:hypothetical protein